MLQQVQAALPGTGNILRRVLTNGISVLVHENHTSPTVIISGYVHAGSQDDDPDAPLTNYMRKSKVSVQVLA